MPHWVVTANGTVSGPFNQVTAKREQLRLIHLNRGVGAADIQIVQADDKNAARRAFKP